MKNDINTDVIAKKKKSAKITSKQLSVLSNVPVGTINKNPSGRNKKSANQHNTCAVQSARVQCQRGADRLHRVRGYNGKIPKCSATACPTAICRPTRPKRRDVC
ncbi:MAG: hypothetical protein L6V93_17445 [Clostridiales bacterium]|nr:MAG: hypothetical protein L6V93_17445 [Clostridiales bacterium]